MKKTFVAVAAGVLLVATQAVAAGTSPDVRVADRVGARAADSSAMVGETGFPGWIVVAGTFVLTAIVIDSVQDESDSN